MCGVEIQHFAKLLRTTPFLSSDLYIFITHNNNYTYSFQIRFYVLKYLEKYFAFEEDKNKIFILKH